MLHRTFGTRPIEELPRSFICGSAELRSGRLEIARHGPLCEAVGSASACRSSRLPRCVAATSSSTARWWTTCR
jgi:predicted acylesterase/phospholipase RssA